MEVTEVNFSKFILGIPTHLSANLTNSSRQMLILSPISGVSHSFHLSKLSLIKIQGLTTNKFRNFL